VCYVCVLCCVVRRYYMSPEMFSNQAYDYKSDVWALGCVLYEMATLDHPFDANSLQALGAKVGREAGGEGRREAGRERRRGCGRREVARRGRRVVGDSDASCLPNPH
jgi:serine/threonine protein kinase